MSKKWYNYFVSTDEGEAGGEREVAPNDAAAQVEELARATGTRPSAPGAQPAAAPPRTAAQVASRVPEPAMPPARAQGAPVSFAEIYKLASISTPLHGYTIFKIAEMLENEYLRGMAPEVKRRSVLVALDAARVKIDEIVQDAVSRDRALDAYERAQQKALDDLQSRKADENRRVQAELDRLVAEHQARIQANNDEVVREKERLYGWRLKKQEEEQRIADAIGYFLSENPITTSAAGPAPPSTPPAARDK